MNYFFLDLINMSITASWLALAVIALRLILKKAPKAITVLLWAIVAIRLIFPFSIESELSLVPSANTVPQEIVFAREPVIDSGVESINSIVNPIITESFAPSNELTSINPIQVFLAIAELLWIAGMCVMALYALISYLRIRLRVKEAIALRENIFICDTIPSPFILGILRPRIYIPSSMNESDIEYVIAHEKAHLRRLDHLWKPIGFALLTVYWFNPILWIAYVLLCRDIELACDERVISDMGADAKKAYSAALLNCSMPRYTVSACPLAFGEVGVKMRIKSVLSYKKPAFWLILVAILATVAIAVGFLTNPKEEGYGELDSITAEAYGVESVVYSAPYLSFMYFPGHNTPSFSVTDDYNLICTRIDGTTSSLGKLKEITLGKSDFDDKFEDYNDMAWRNGLSAKKLRKGAARAWTIEGDNLFYLIQQKDGGVYVAFGTNKLHYVFMLEASVYDDTGLIAVSGENSVPVTVFSTKDPIEEIKKDINWLDIVYDENAFTPFDIYCDGNIQLGFFSIYDANTLEPLDFFHPSGLSPHTYIFQNAQAGGEYIITMKYIAFTEDESADLLCFGARLPGEPPVGTVIEVPPIEEQPSGKLSMVFFTYQDVIGEPKEISDLSFSFEKNAFSSSAMGVNTDYIDNLVLSNTDGEDYVLSFVIYQDMLPYINTLFATLNSTVTVDYEGKVMYDKRVNANEHIKINVNGMSAEITEVSLGAGNGHRDFYITFHTDEYVEFKEITEFSFAVNQEPTNFGVEISKGNAPIILECGEITVRPVITTDYGEYKEFILTAGAKQRTFIGECLRDDHWRKEMYVEDLTGDGVFDITVVFQNGHGTEVSTEDIHVFDGVTLEEYAVEKLYDTISRHVNFSADDDNCYVKTDDMTYTIDKNSLSPAYEKENWRDFPATNNIFHFFVENGTLKIEMPCQYAPVGFVGDIIAEYAFKNGEFVYASATYEE